MISKFPLFTSNLLNIKDYRFDVFVCLKSVYRPHQATQSVLVCSNTHRQEMVFAFFYLKSGKSHVNTVDKRLDDIACVQSFSKVLGTLASFHEKSTYTVDISIKSIFPPPRLPNQCWFPNLNTLTHNMLC